MPSRMDTLIGNRYAVKAFRDLPVTHQLAIAHFMAIEGEAWELLGPLEGASDSETVKASLEAALPEYVKKYGDCHYGVVDLPAESVKQAVMLDEELASSFSGWDEYQAWYLGGGGIPEHPPTNRWPVVLSNYDDETLRDGWHRLHSYLRACATTVPAVFYPEVQRGRPAYPRELSFDRAFSPKFFVIIQSPHQVAGSCLCAIETKKSCAVRHSS